MTEENAIFEREMNVVEISRTQTEMDGNITKEEEPILKGSDCIMALRRYGEGFAEFNDSKIVKVVITGGK